jgi:hypothetical protein
MTFFFFIKEIFSLHEHNALRTESSVHDTLDQTFQNSQMPHNGVTSNCNITECLCFMEREWRGHTFYKCSHW